MLANHNLIPAMTARVIEEVQRSRRQPFGDKLAMLSVDEERVLALMTQLRTRPHHRDTIKASAWSRCPPRRSQQRGQLQDIRR